MTDILHSESEKARLQERVELQNVATGTDLRMSDLVTETEMNQRIDEIKQKSSPPPKVSIRVNTNLQHDEIFTQNDLDERVAKFAKTYESNFLSPNLAKKVKMINSSVQTADKPEKKPSKDIGLQVMTKVTDIGILVKPKVASSAHQTFRSTKEIGVSDDTVNPYSCDKCNVKKSNVGTLFPDRTDQLLQRISSRAEITVAKKKSVSRSTDTQELLSTRDVSMNTSKKKLVSTSVETGDYTCKTCTQQVQSPSLVQMPAKRPSYLPISVNRGKTASTPSPQPQLQNEGSNSDSGSDEGTYTIHQDVGACFKGDDQSPMSGSYTRREPSKEMRGAMKVLNDALLKSHGGDIPKHVKTAVNIVQQEWFKVSSVASANPLDVEYYLDCFEEISGTLLEHVVNMSDVSGNTAMHYAVSNGNFDVVSILLDSKVCNINKLNTAGYTCIMLVALTKVKSETDREVVRRLFHMADVNIRAKQHGQTALMLAVSHGRIDTVELLLEAGADINIQDDDGSTALMCAAEHGYIEIVKLLLAQPDCDLSITDYDGTTALAIAMEAGNRDVGVLLYAQEHFSRGSSPYTSLKHKRSKSTTPTLKSSRPTTPSHSSAKKDSEIES
uniref:KN motif and ankyrin repeat domain-containing protein 1 n=1 Tax=Lygus hesperus TaxID=30085 RepID=A0A0A9W5M2_LYGHE